MHIHVFQQYGSMHEFEILNKFLYTLLRVEMSENSWIFSEDQIKVLTEGEFWNFFWNEDVK